MQASYELPQLTHELSNHYKPSQVGDVGDVCVKAHGANIANRLSPHAGQEVS